MSTIHGAGPAIRVDGVSKTYRVWRSPGDRLVVPIVNRLENAIAPRLPKLARGLRRQAEQRFHDITALDEISFTLALGDSLGIVGPNGSGKSTLLQIISGLIQPSAGSVEVNGKVAALLELGSGFNPEFTGRENIFLNGAILGIPRDELSIRLDSIIDFAELGEFIDQPIKTYSTGMVARLAFAVQVHVDPVILIVDETLSVGDAAFQARAMTKIDEILNRGTTLLFVGHDLQMVRSFCNRAIYLNQGKMMAEGDPDDVTRQYIFDAHHSQIERHFGDTRIVKTRLIVGADDVGVVEASIDQGHRHVAVSYGETIALHFVIFVGADMQNPRIFIDILDSNSIQLGGRVVALPREYLHQAVTLTANVQATLKKGVYRVRIRVADAPSLHAVSLRWRHDDMLSFEVTSDSRERFLGVFPIPMETEWLAHENG